MDMIETLPSFASTLKTVSSSAAVSFVHMRSSVHSAFPLKDTNDRRTLSYGDCLDRYMEVRHEVSSSKGKNVSHPE